MNQSRVGPVWSPASQALCSVATTQSHPRAPGLPGALSGAHPGLIGACFVLAWSSFAIGCADPPGLADFAPLAAVEAPLNLGAAALGAASPAQEGPVDPKRGHLYERSMSSLQVPRTAPVRLEVQAHLLEALDGSSAQEIVDLQLKPESVELREKVRSRLERGVRAPMLPPRLDHAFKAAKEGESDIRLSFGEAEGGRAVTVEGIWVCKPSSSKEPPKVVTLRCDLEEGKATQPANGKATSGPRSAELSGALSVARRQDAQGGVVEEEAHLHLRAEGGAGSPLRLESRYRLHRCAAGTACRTPKWASAP